MSSAQNSHPQQPSYEPYKPEIETQETADAHILLVRLPDFTRQQVGAYYEAAYKRIRVFGEKPIENNKRIRFSEVYEIPENGDADKLKGQFQEGAIITLTIPKKPKEPEPEPEADKQLTTTPQKSASEVKSEAAETKNGEKGVPEEKPESEMESSQKEHDEKKDGKPTPPPEQEVTEESKITKRDTTQEEQKNHGATEEEKGSESGIPQKDQDQEGKGIPQEDDKSDKNQKISEEGKASPQKDQFLAIDESKESEGNESDLFIAYESSGLKERPEKREEEEELFPTDQSLEREKSKDEIKESALFIAYESSGLKKAPEKREEEESFPTDQCSEREKSKDEIKESAMDIAAKSYDIGSEKASEEEEEMQMGVQTDEVHEERSHESTVSSESSSIGRGMITRLANRFSEDDKHKKLLCAGAAIMVVAVGIYASFKLRSMTRVTRP